MLISINRFQGAAPRIDPRKLAPEVAQIAVNIDYEDGTLSPLRPPETVHTFGSPVLSFFKDGVNWLGFSSVVSIARGPVAQDRLYYTGSGAPKMRISGVDYNLALPAPAAAPTITNLSAPSAGAEEVLYAYTFVTSFGEESPPSPFSALIDYSPGVVQRVTGFSAAPVGRGVTAMRIYRSQTSFTGATDLFFAAEVPIATALYDYDAVATPLAEAITCRDYDPPPDALAGLITMPNGMMAAYVGRELYFSEPYKPHAWPEKYVLIVNSPIVGLAAFGSSLAVLTEGSPYIVQGITPDQMAMELVETGQPCLSNRSIVDVGYSAIYASSDGLMLIGEGQRTNLTEMIFSREQWLALNPSSIFAGRFKGQYIFIHNSIAFDLYDCGLPAGWGGALEDTLDGGDPLLTGGPYDIFDFGEPFSSFGEQTVSWVDALQREQPGLVSSTVAAPLFMFSDPADNNLYILDGDGVSVQRWLPDGTTPVPALWRSKVFTSNVPMAPGALYIQTTRAKDVGDTFMARVYAGGTLLHEIDTPNAIKRLPAGRQNLSWEIEIETTIPVQAAYMANTPDEILVALT
jgi:hypothetical protein